MGESLYLQRRTATFVVRVWLEYLQTDSPCWRGEIVYLPTGERVYFQDLNALSRFVEAQLQPPPTRAGENV